MFKTSEETKAAAEAYSQLWLVNAIERVKAELNRPEDIPSVLEVAFTDGYRTGYLHATQDSKAKAEK